MVSRRAYFVTVIVAAAIDVLVDRVSADTTLKADLTGMRKAIDAFYADKQKYPATLDDLVREKYLKAIPVDPITNAKDWQTTMSERDPANPSAEPGIAEVKSNASGTSSDGTPFSEL